MKIAQKSPVLLSCIWPGVEEGGTDLAYYYSEMKGARVVFFSWLRNTKIIYNILRSQGLLSPVCTPPGGALRCVLQSFVEFDPTIMSADCSAG